jgi:hypothetical protein
MEVKQNPVGKGKPKALFVCLISNIEIILF